MEGGDTAASSEPDFTPAVRGALGTISEGLVRSGSISARDSFAPTGAEDHSRVGTEEDGTFAKAVADALAAKLVTSVRDAVQPLFLEQEQRLQEMLDRHGKKFSGSPRRQHSPSSSLRGDNTDPGPQGRTRLQSGNFRSDTNSLTVNGVHTMTTISSGRAQTFDQLMPQRGFNRQFTPGSVAGAGIAKSPVPTLDRLPLPKNESLASEESDMQPTPSMERRVSLTKRWARWRGMINNSVGHEGKSGPEGMQALEDARASELLAGIALHEEDRERKSPDKDREGLAGRIPTLTKLLGGGPTRVSTCPDVRDYMTSPSPKGNAATGSAAPSQNASSGSPKKSDADPRLLNFPNMRQALQGRRPREPDNVASKYASDPEDEEEPPAYYSSSSHQSQIPSQSQGYVINLERPGQSLGIDVRAGRDGIVITGISPDGAISEHNAKSRLQVRVGDKIVEVDGDTQNIIENLQVSKAPCIRFQRPQGGGAEGRGSRATEENEAADLPHGFAILPEAQGLKEDPDAEAEEQADAQGLPGRLSSSSAIDGEAQSPGESNVRCKTGGGTFDDLDRRDSPRPIMLQSDDQRLPFSSLMDKDHVPARSPHRKTTGGRNTGGFKSETTTLRIEREDELLNDMANGFDFNEEVEGVQSLATLPTVQRTASDSWLHDSQVRSPLLLRVCGILPWQSSACRCFYRSAMMILSAGFIAVFSENLATAQRSALEDSECTADVCLQFKHLCDLLLAVGSFLGLLALRPLLTNKLLGSDFGLLVVYARRQDVVSKWFRAARRQFLLLLLLWVSSIALRWSLAFPSSDRRDKLTTAAFTFVSVLFSGITYAILHISCAIATLIDSYCLHLTHDKDLSKGVREWNMLQALLRKASRAVESGVLVMQTTALAVVLVSASSLLLQGDADFRWIFSNVLLALSIGLILFKAAEVTEKCTRVPSLVNSLTFSKDMDVERHYLVEYVTYSMAGFYVGEVRLTAAMALKFTYISGLAAFGVLTKLTSIE